MKSSPCGRVKKGQLYKHKKGHYYEIVEIERDSESNDTEPIFRVSYKSVAYFQQPHLHEPWSRELSMFLDPGRFEFIRQITIFDRIRWWVKIKLRNFKNKWDGGIRSNDSTNF